MWPRGAAAEGSVVMDKAPLQEAEQGPCRAIGDNHDPGRLLMRTKLCGGSGQVVCGNYAAETETGGWIDKIKKKKHRLIATKR